jgi:hypothetical protein
MTASERASPKTPPPQIYIRPSQLAKILGWSRPNVYYWLNRCKVNLVEIAGYKMVAVDDLPRLVMMLTKAKEEAHERRHSV